MLTGITKCSVCDDKADAVEGDVPYCAKHWLEEFAGYVFTGGTNDESNKGLGKRDGRGRSVHDTGGVVLKIRE